MRVWSLLPLAAALVLAGCGAAETVPATAPAAPAAAGAKEPVVTVFKSPT